MKRSKERLALTCLFLRGNWNDDNIFTSSPPSTNVTFDKIKTSHYDTVVSPIWILNSIFERCQHDRSGGAITNGLGGEMLVEFCCFKECFCTGQTSAGGGIHQASSGSCLINKCCSYQCYTLSSSHYGQFIFVQLQATSKTNILDSSVCHSMQSYNSRSLGDSLNIMGSEALLHNTNLSNNICCQYSALEFTPSTAKSPACVISYTSINGNSASEYSILLFYQHNKVYDVTKSNIIYNTDNAQIGVFYSKGITKISDCCIMNNTARFLFYGDVSTSGSVTVINCTINNDPHLATSGNVILENDVWNAKTSFIIPIRCTKKEGYCSASYDSVADMYVKERDEKETNHFMSTFIYFIILK